jgi:protocatechuate 3,4-dioxygenase beta subunit
MRCISTLAAILVALTFVPSSMRAQQSPRSAFGTIQGTVTKSGSNDPLVGARVSLAGGIAGTSAMQNLLSFAASQGLVIPPPPPGTTDEQIAQAMMEAAIARGMPIGPADIQSALDRFGGATPPVTTTDSAGRFTFANVAAGRYTVRVERNGYFGTSIIGPSPMALTNAVVAVGQTVSVAISMTPTAVISGQVRDSAGRPMSNVDVQAYRVFYASGMPLLDPVASKPTDDLGEYRLIWVLPGEYYVAVAPRPPSAATIAARNPQDVATFFPQATDASAAIPVAVRAGEEASGINIGVRRVRPFHIYGTVNSYVPPPPVSANAQGVFVVINQVENSLATLFIVPRSTTTVDNEDFNSVVSVPLNSSNGQFDIPNILPGSYDIYARVNDKESPAIGHVEVDVVNQDVTGLKVDVRSPVVVAGSVTVSMPDGSTPPMESWRVMLEAAGSLAKMGFGMRRGPIGARLSPISKEGTYNVQGVPPGHYRLLVTGLSSGFYVDSVRQNGMSVQDSGFDVGIESPTPIQIVVKSGAGSVEGVAQAGAIVAMIPASRRENHALYYGATADALGAFAIRGVAPGEYKIFAWESTPGGAYLNADFLKKYEDSGRAVTVTPDSKLKFDPAVIK